REAAAQRRPVARRWDRAVRTGRLNHRITAVHVPDTVHAVRPAIGLVAHVAAHVADVDRPPRTVPVGPILTAGGGVDVAQRQPALERITGRSPLTDVGRVESPDTRGRAVDRTTEAGLAAAGEDRPIVVG